MSMCGGDTEKDIEEGKEGGESGKDTDGAVEED